MWEKAQGNVDSGIKEKKITTTIGVSFKRSSKFLDWNEGYIFPCFENGVKIRIFISICISVFDIFINLLFLNHFTPT